MVFDLFFFFRTNDAHRDGAGCLHIIYDLCNGQRVGWRLPTISPDKTLFKSARWRTSLSTTRQFSRRDGLDIARIACVNERRSTIRRVPFRRLSSGLCTGPALCLPAMRSRIVSVPSMVIAVNLHAIQSTAAPVVACPPSRPCQPAAECYGGRCASAAGPGESRGLAGPAASRRSSWAHVAGCARRPSAPGAARGTGARDTGWYPRRRHRGPDRERRRLGREVLVQHAGKVGVGACLAGRLAWRGACKSKYQIKGRIGMTIGCLQFHEVRGFAYTLPVPYWCASSEKSYEE